MKKLVLLILYLLKFLFSDIGIFLFGAFFWALFILPTLLIGFDFFKTALILQLVCYVIFYEFWFRKTKTEVKRKELFNIICQIIIELKNPS